MAAPSGALKRWASMADKVGEPQGAEPQVSAAWQAVKGNVAQLFERRVREKEEGQQQQQQQQRPALARVASAAGVGDRRLSLSPSSLARDLALKFEVKEQEAAQPVVSRMRRAQSIISTPTASPKMVAIGDPSGGGGGGARTSGAAGPTGGGVAEPASPLTGERRATAPRPEDAFRTFKALEDAPNSPKRKKKQQEFIVRRQSVALMAGQFEAGADDPDSSEASSPRRPTVRQDSAAAVRERQLPLQQRLADAVARAEPAAMLQRSTSSAATRVSSLKRSPSRVTVVAPSPAEVRDGHARRGDASPPLVLSVSSAEPSATQRGVSSSTVGAAPAAAAAASGDAGTPAALSTAPPPAPAAADVDPEPMTLAGYCFPVEDDGSAGGVVTNVDADARGATTGGDCGSAAPAAAEAAGAGAEGKDRYKALSLSLSRAVMDEILSDAPATPADALTPPGAAAGRAGGRGLLSPRSPLERASIATQPVAAHPHAPGSAGGGSGGLLTPTTPEIVDPRVAALLQYAAGRPQAAPRTPTTPVQHGAAAAAAPLHRHSAPPARRYPVVDDPRTPVTPVHPVTAAAVAAAVAAEEAGISRTWSVDTQTTARREGGRDADVEAEPPAAMASLAGTRDDVDVCRADHVDLAAAAAAPAADAADVSITVTRTMTTGESSAAGSEVRVMASHELCAQSEGDGEVDAGVGYLYRKSDLQWLYAEAGAAVPPTRADGPAATTAVTTSRSNTSSTRNPSPPAPPCESVASSHLSPPLQPGGCTPKGRRRRSMNPSPRASPKKKPAAAPASGRGGKHGQADTPGGTPAAVVLEATRQHVVSPCALPIAMPMHQIQILQQQPQQQPPRDEKQERVERSPLRAVQAAPVVQAAAPPPAPAAPREAQAMLERLQADAARVKDVEAENRALRDLLRQVQQTQTPVGGGGGGDNPTQHECRVCAASAQVIAGLRASLEEAEAAKARLAEQLTATNAALLAGNDRYRSAQAKVAKAEATLQQIANACAQGGAPELAAALEAGAGVEPAVPAAAQVPRSPAPAAPAGLSALSALATATLPSAPRPPPALATLAADAVSAPTSTLGFRARISPQRLRTRPAADDPREAAYRAAVQGTPYASVNYRRH